MRRTLWIVFTLVGCGDDAAKVPDGGGMPTPDSPTCQPQSAVGSFYRRTPNPRLVAGGHTFTDSKLDTSIADPDLSWDGATWHIYYGTDHGTYGGATVPLIREATSPDLATWTPRETPTLGLPTDTNAWDAVTIEAPSVVFDAAAPADRRYMMFYAGTKSATTAAFRAYSIGLAISADGITFTRILSGDSPKGEAGLVLTGADAYPAATSARLSDPDVVLVGSTFHMWFSSQGCNGSTCTGTGIGHATSTDGLHWTIDAAPVPSLLRMSSDPNSGGGQPSAVYDDVHCKWEMWLANDSPATENDNQPTESANMVGVWHATSTNAASWTISYTQVRDLVWDGTASGEHLGMRTGADVAIRSGGRYMVYTGYDDQNVPTGATLPTRTGTTSAVMTLDLATRDAPP